MPSGELVYARRFKLDQGSLFGQQVILQSGAACHSQGFEDKHLGSSPGWWATTVATYCPSRLGELPKFVSSKPCE